MKPVTTTLYIPITNIFKKITLSCLEKINGPLQRTQTNNIGPAWFYKRKIYSDCDLVPTHIILRTLF